MVIYEAQAAGCVVVASDLGGMSEMIRAGEDGLLFPPGDSAALAQVLKNLCEDRPMVARLATNAPRPLSVKDQVTRLQGIYRQILGL
jgi:glycosyltransferase involved in cell wall biosynthesis